MISEEIKGIVLNNKIYKDNSLLLTILNNEGLEKLILRGALKIDAKNRSLTKIGSVIIYKKTTDKKTNVLTSGTVINYLDFSDNINKIHQFEVVAELIMTLKISINDYDILFNFMLKWLELLNINAYENVLRLVFETKLLYLLGIGPDFKSCAICNKPHDHYIFSLNEGKVIGKSCYKYHLDDVYLDEEETLIFKLIYLISIEKIDENLLKGVNKYYSSLNKFIDLYYETYYNYHSITKKIINQL